MTDKQKKIAIIVIFVLAICWMVPACHWDSTITSGRFVSEASIVEMDRSADSMTVRLYNSSADESKVETSTYLTLGGMIPEDAYMSERVMIGYSKDGLYADTKQTVEVSFFKKGNLITVGSSSTVDGDYARMALHLPTNIEGIAPRGSLCRCRISTLQSLRALQGRTADVVWP